VRVSGGRPVVAGAAVAWRFAALQAAGPGPGEAAGVVTERAGRGRRRSVVTVKPGVTPHPRRRGPTDPGIWIKAV